MFTSLIFGLIYKIFSVSYHNIIEPKFTLINMWCCLNSCLKTHYYIAAKIFKSKKRISTYFQSVWNSVYRTDKSLITMFVKRAFWSLKINHKRFLMSTLIIRDAAFRKCRWFYNTADAKWNVIHFNYLNKLVYSGGYEKLIYMDNFNVWLNSAF